MKIYIFIFLASVLLFPGCKTGCDDCTKMDSNKVQQIESQDHYVPWWIKSK